MQFFLQGIGLCMLFLLGSNNLLSFVSFSIRFTNGSRLSWFRSSLSCNVYGRCWSSKTKFCTYTIIWYSFTTHSRFAAQITFINFVSKSFTHAQIYTSCIFLYSLILQHTQWCGCKAYMCAIKRIYDFFHMISFCFSFVLCSSILFYLCVFAKWIYVIMYDSYLQFHLNDYIFLFSLSLHISVFFSVLILSKEYIYWFRRMLSLITFRL
jgi:hypothetical protein